MAKSDAKNPGMVDTSDWQKEQVGFDPYLHIEEGVSIVATLIGRDDTDKKFIRYNLMSAQVVQCQRGPNDESSDRHEKVMVNPGETYNMSSFFSLEKPFNEYLNYSEDTGKAVTFKLTCTGSAKTKSGQDVWLWDLLVSPKTKMELAAWRKDHAPRALKAGNEARAQIES